MYEDTGSIEDADGAALKDASKQEYVQTSFSLAPVQ